MSRKSRQSRQKLETQDMLIASDGWEVDLDDEFGDFDAEDEDYGEWWEEIETQSRMSARRKIERRQDRNALLAELNDW